MKTEIIYKAGGRGNTVVLLRRPGSRNLYLRWWDASASGGKGNYAWQSLQHEDVEEGKDAADDAAKILRKGASPLKAKGLTVAQLFEEYRTIKSSRKRDRQAGDDRRRIGYWLEFLGAAREAITVDPDTCEAYAQHRREQGIGDTTIGHELVFLRGVFEWATTRRTSTGQPLLPFNPAKTVKRIRSADPRTPVANQRVYTRVLSSADAVCSQKLFGSFITLVREHGWRLSAWCQLRVADIDLEPREVEGVIWPHGAIRKRREHDKKGKGGWVPLTPRSRETAAQVLEQAGDALPEAYLFPAVKGGGSWTAYHAHRLLRRAEKQATIELRKTDPGAKPVKLGGFHALRRKWGSDRKHEPLVDVAAAGDWHPSTLLHHYQKADAQTTLRVTLGGERRRVP